MGKPKAAAAAAWPADQVERRAVDALIPYARNARKHPPAQVAQIADSIRTYGFTVPVLVDEDGGIIAGHGRVLAAKQVGLKDVPTMVARGWTAEKKRAYVLLDNKLALNTEWDADLLRLELESLQAADFSLVSLGFTDAEFAALKEPDPEPGDGRGTSRLGKSIIQFNIVFDDELQQAAWFALIRRLKAAYPEAPTLGARLARLIEEKALATG